MKKAMLGMSSMALVLAAMSAERMNITEEPPTTIKPKNPQPKKASIPFHKQEGISKTIIEYNHIRKGESKQGERKQLRTVRKIESWIDNGFLTLDDLQPKLKTE
mgnify:CR=1 FL=1